MQHEKESDALLAIVQNYRQLLAHISIGVPECVVQYSDEDRRCRYRAAELIRLDERCKVHASKSDQKQASRFQDLRTKVNAAVKREWGHHPRDGHNWYLELFAKRYLLPVTTARVVECPLYSRKRDLFWRCIEDSHSKRREAWFHVNLTNKLERVLQSYEIKRRLIDDQLHLAMSRLYVVNRIMILERYTPLCPDLIRSIIEEWLF